MTRLVLTPDNVLPPLKELSVGGSAPGNPGLTNVDDATVYSAAEEDALLMILAVDCNVKNPTKRSPYPLISL